MEEEGLPDTKRNKLPAAYPAEDAMAAFVDEDLQDQGRHQHYQENCCRDEDPRDVPPLDKIDPKMGRETDEPRQ